MLSADEYKRILAQHGRRVANRVALAATPKGDRGGFNSFYACYGSSEGLPEHERCKSGLIDKFDPIGWLQLYPSADPLRIAYRICPDRSWITALETLTPEQCRYIHALITDQAVLDTASDEIAEFIESLRVEDVVTIFTLLVGRTPRADIEREARLASAFAELTSPKRHPDPGTPEAEAYIAGREAKE